MFPCSLRYFANVPLFPKTPGRPSILSLEFEREILYFTIIYNIEYYLSIITPWQLHSSSTGDDRITSDRLIEHTGPARFILLHMLDAIRVVSKKIVLICLLLVVYYLSLQLFFCMVSVVKGRFRITTVILIMLAAKGRCFHTAIDSCAHRDFNGSFLFCRRNQARILSDLAWTLNGKQGKLIKVEPDLAEFCFYTYVLSAERVSFSSLAPEVQQGISTFICVNWKDNKTSHDFRVITTQS